MTNQEPAMNASHTTGAPSPRDQDIYRQVKVECRKQCDVAAEIGRSRGQVSRIVKRVAAWRATQTRGGQGEPSHDEQRRLGRWLAHERAEELYARSLRLMQGEERGQEPGAGSQAPGAQELRAKALELQAIKT